MLQHNLEIEIVKGKLAPRYSSGTELVCEGVVITENGTVSDLPIVDFKMRGPDGKFYLLPLTGRLVISLAAAVRGVNLRNHGTEDP
jgi:hypothetical protein